MIYLLKKALTMLIAIPVIAEASPDTEFRVINGSYKVNNIVITEKLKKVMGSDARSRIISNF